MIPMLLAISSILLTISSGITMFIQSITLAGCRIIECGSTSCQIGEKPLEEKDDDVMPMAVPGEVASEKDAL